MGLREAEVFFARAVARDRLSLRQEALADCTAAIELDPKYVAAYNSRGLIQTMMGLYNEALADLNEAIRLAPNWGLPYLNRGRAHVAFNDLDSAISDYTRVISLSSQRGVRVDHHLCAAAYANRARVYRLQGDETRAAADLQEVERLSKNL